MLVEAYFDESYGTKPERLLCVAGYLIESESAKLLAKDWQEVLDWKGLPYFHMVECAHGNGPYKSLTKQERIMVVSRMIGNIKRHAFQGLACAMNVAQFEKLMPDHPLIGSPYTFCAHVILGGVQNWAATTNYKGDIAYFFEAGHASQQEANQIMNKVFAHPKLKHESRYAAHAFVDKTKMAGIQAADLLAWQYYTDVRRRIEGKRERRKDFASLIAHPHNAVLITPEMMVDLDRYWRIEDDTGESLVNLHLGNQTKFKKLLRPRNDLAK